MARKMKDSGIEWIGLIPQAWAVQRVKNLADVYTGNSIKDDQKEFYEDPTEAIPYIATKDIDVTLQTIDFENGMYVKINDDSFKRAPSQSTLLCIEGGSAGKKIAFIEQDVCFVNKLCCLHSNTEFNKFLYYYFMSPAFTQLFNSYISGLIGGVSVKELCNFVITLPPFEEQEQIAMFLDLKCKHIDSVIEKTHAAIEEYKKLKQTVITQAVTKGIRPNRKMKDSGIEWIGEIPSTFVCRKLKSFSTLISKGSTPKDISTEIDDKYVIRFLKSENIVENHLAEKPEFRITSDIHEGELKRSVLYENDILFVIAGASIGKTAIMDKRLLPANTNQAVSFIRIVPKYCFAKKYIWYFLQSEVVKRFIFLFAVQSAQPNLSMENLGSIRMPFPKSKEEVLEIITYLDEKTAAIDSLIQKKEQLISELEAYKKSLIYEYVTGKKEVPVHAH